MPSTTINLRSGNYSTSSFGIDPTMPAILRVGRVQETEWKVFCDAINEKLKPLNRLRRMSQIATVCFCISFVAVMTIFGVTFTSSMNKSEKNYYYLLFIVPLLMILGLVGWSVYVSKKTQEAYKGIRDVCAEASQKQSSVSYHFRDDVVIGAFSGTNSSSTTYRNVYIEVSISDQPVDQPHSYATGYPSATTAATPFPYISSNTTGEAPAARLQKLENMKHLLSTQEYEDKRAEILMSV